MDYFMSHSWHDCADSKWLKLQEVASDFMHRHWRYPTFWLDKVCIDQRRLADGLKALPVNVMACRQVLVLCGATYPDRLWCMWELCVVLSFALQEHALERIRFEALEGDDSSSEIFQRLQSFDAENARCYDPNEQARLFQVIHTIGSDRFNMQIRQLAAAMQFAARAVSIHPFPSISMRMPSLGLQASMLGSRTFDEESCEASVVSI
eukprot:TRINITY_DN22424_c0_g1_i3.p1 TRINITY_DN22424_c0_g1~~TRINITY_DN22424_c0_g1_i3.p1  ORF type:complete len:207 (-),score=7.84 TRINITY_DN22424_c0_g1_i3:66-686(-)